MGCFLLQGLPAVHRWLLSTSAIEELNRIGLEDSVCCSTVALQVPISYRVVSHYLKFVNFVHAQTDSFDCLCGPVGLIAIETLSPGISASMEHP